MPEFCVWRKYAGPTCYEVTAEEKRNLEILSLFLGLAVMILIIAVIFWHKKTGSEKQFLIALGLITLVLIIWSGVYQSTVTSRSELICSGARECTGTKRREVLQKL